ncbi:hypothetical protein EXS70_04725 [Candidatus Peribacteria bacterium]|nr:hypothetical protein [Candidatus Peribacteria bacterium]
MNQLARFLFGHFASKHSPTRERREVGFAKKGKNGKDKGSEPEVHGGEGQGGHSKEISAHREATTSKMAIVAPEMLDVMQEVLESRDARAGNELAADVLHDPARAIKVLYAIDGRIQQYEELTRIAEHRTNAVLKPYALHSLDVVSALHYDEKNEAGGNDAADALPNEDQRNSVWDARDALRKKRTMEELAGYGPGQGQEYLASLKQHSTTMREHLYLQLQERTKQMVEKCESALGKVKNATAGKHGTKRAYFLDKVADLQELQKDIDDTDSHNPSFADATENFLGLLTESAQELQMYERGDFSTLDVDKTFRERQVWIQERKDLVQKLIQRKELKDADKDFLEKLEKRLNALSPTMPAITEQERERIDIAIASMSHGGPDTLERARAEEKLNDDPVTLTWCNGAEETLNDVSSPLVELLGKDDGRTPAVTTRTKEKIDNLRHRLKTIGSILLDVDKKKIDPHSEALRRERRNIDIELQKLEECYEELKKIREAGVKPLDNLEEYKKKCDDAGGTSIACYQPRDRRMYANGTLLQTMTPDALQKKLREIEQHEFNHAIKHILETTIFPNLLFDELTWLFPETSEKPGGDDSERSEFENLLFAVEKEWHIEERWKASGMLESLGGKDSPSAKKERLRMVLDELGEEYRSWQSGKKSPRSDAEKKLHELYAKKRSEVPYSRLALHMTADEQAQTDGHDEAAARTGGVPGAATASPEQGETADPATQFRELQKKIREIEAFGMEHSEYGGEIHDILDGNGKLRQRMSDLQQLIDHPAGLPPDRIANDLGIIAAEVDDIHDHMKDARDKLLDPTYAQPTIPSTFWSRLHFLSLSDIAKICKDLKEDWLAESARAQERKTSEVEEALTSAIPDDLPFPWGKYTSRLKHYARRRKTSTEQEASKKWEDALQLRDPHELLGMLGRSPTKDQLKAIITLLCHKGQMDWNDPNFIQAIETESGYKIPAEAMKKDVDRDKWLRKILTAIWPDEKEFYDHSRVENDSAFDSAKGKYTSLADDISNIKGELARQLKDMLTIWKESGGHPPIEISPHKYEEIIHFAMRDGKMTMQEKFYYLVRGAASGLLPPQRVRALAGEKAGLLNKFPFIDYFSSNDNTLPQLQKRAEELTERDWNGNDTFKPGAKTTMWLHRVVAQDEGVRTRVLKGADKIAENMDHEDIPFFITALGVNVNVLASTISGHRQKVSKLGWKNAYCGYSSKFKIFGMIAKLERDGKPGAHIKNEDIQALAQNLGGYIFMDNALTRSVCDNFADTGRPKLAEAEYNGLEAPSATPGKNTRAYQTRLNGFVRGVLSKDSIRSAISSDAVWIAKCSEHGFADPTTTLNKFAPLDPNDPWARNTEEQAGKLAKLNDAFLTALEKAITKNSDTQSDFKDALINSADTLLNEGGSKDLTIDLVEANLRAEAAAAGERAGGGEHH